jgi:hypothetical protein
LRHPNLLYLSDCGIAEVAGAEYIFSVFENPDDNLASALEEGPISEAETREVLEVALNALRYLHNQGMVHGAVRPQKIVAVGNTIKLATDSLRESDDLEGVAEDVRQLGELVKTLLGTDAIGGALEIIVRNATEPDRRNRWTLAELARELQASPISVAPEVPAAASTPEPAPELPALIEPEPAVVTLAPELPPPARHRPVEPALPIAFPKWIFVGVAIVLLLILAMNLRRKPDKPVRPAPAAAEPAPAPPQPLPPLPRPAPENEAAKGQPTPATSTGRAMWRVIAFTYRSRDAAAKRARHVNERWPDLQAAVFAPAARHGYYLVALGGPMTRDDAVRVQEKARNAGLPRDIYVQNYDE